jgi:hypothetical protein
VEAVIPQWRSINGVATLPKKQQSTVDSTKLNDKQLDALCGGSPSLWDILGPSIEEVVNAKPPAMVCTCTCSY